jgi:hypothetical protein
MKNEEMIELIDALHGYAAHPPRDGLNLSADENTVFEHRMKYTTTINLFEQASKAKDAQQFKKIAAEIAERIGARDALGVYFIKPTFQTKTSRALKAPSLDYPNNFFDHVQTKKYIEAFFNEYAIRFLGRNLKATGGLLKSTEAQLKNLKQEMKNEQYRF